MKLYKYVLAVIPLLTGLTTHAQLNLAASSYFQNQYLNNPAYVGLEEGLSLSSGVNQLFTNVPGAMAQQFFTANYGNTDRGIGLGLILRNEKAGLIRKTDVRLSYAYHLPLINEDEHLNFGLSLGIQNQRIDLSEIEAEVGDVQATRFNETDLYIDGDFGMSYTSPSWSAQISLPNLKNMMTNDGELGVDRYVFIAALSYKFRMFESKYGVQYNTDVWSLEPKLVFRDIKGYTDIIDAGAQVNFADDTLHLMYMYHSTKSNTFGLSIKAGTQLDIMGMYTTNTAAMKNYVNTGRFVAGLKLTIFYFITTGIEVLL